MRRLLGRQSGSLIDNCAEESLADASGYERSAGIKKRKGGGNHNPKRKRGTALLTVGCSDLYSHLCAASRSTKRILIDNCVEESLADASGYERSAGIKKRKGGGNHNPKRKRGTALLTVGRSDLYSHLCGGFSVDKADLD